MPPTWIGPKANAFVLLATEEESGPRSRLRSRTGPTLIDKHLCALRSPCADGRVLVFGGGYRIRVTAWSRVTAC